MGIGVPYLPHLLLVVYVLGQLVASGIFANGMGSQIDVAGLSPLAGVVECGGRLVTAI
jgi:hypothetical protein